MSTHTAGPWHVGVRQAERIVYDKSGWAIANCTVYHAHGDTEPTDNARLIAAAPDLLAALKAIAPMFDNDSPLLTVYAAEIKQAQEAIAKATS